MSPANTAGSVNGHIAVLGAGAWGTAMAVHAAGPGQFQQGRAGAGRCVRLWARNPAQVAQLAATRVNARYLPGVTLPPGVEPVADLQEAVDGAALVVVATSTAGLRETLLRLSALYPSTAPPRAGDGAQSPPGLIWLCKGFEGGTGALAHEIAGPLLGSDRHGVLSGPSFAQEVAAGLPVALTAACTSARLLRTVSGLLHHGAMRIYGSSDVVGVEVAGALKNVMAIATGMCDGLSLGANARAALMTRGLAEMTRLGVALGAEPATFAGLAGVGDLVLTCTGDLSRNRRVGLRLAAGESLPAIVADLGHVAEGVVGCQAAVGRARSNGVEIPVSEAVLDVLEGRLTPGDAVHRLLAREPRETEVDGT